MRKKKNLFFWLLLIILLNTKLSAEEELTSKQLIDKAKEYNGKSIVYSGEIIGEVMKRKNFSYINVCDHVGCLAVWVDSNLTNKIRWTGGYNKKGDWFRIEGKFNYACKEHLGQTDIHAEKMDLILEGKKINSPLDKNKIVLSLVLLGGVLSSWILRQLKKNLD